MSTALFLLNTKYIIATFMKKRLRWNSKILQVKFFVYYAELFAENNNYKQKNMCSYTGSRHYIYPRYYPFFLPYCILTSGLCSEVDKFAVS